MNGKLGPLLVLAVGLCHAAASRAQEPEAVTQAELREVEVIVVGSEAQLAWLQSLIETSSVPNAHVGLSRVEHFEPREVLDQHQRPSGSLRSWVDLRDPRRARVLMRSRASDRFLVRELALSGAENEMDRQALSHVLTLSWSALLDDTQAGIDRGEATHLLEPQRPQAPEMKTLPARDVAGKKGAAQGRFALEAGVLYAVQAFSKELPIVHGPGVELLGAHAGFSPRPALWLTAQYRLPQSEQSKPIGVALEGVALRGGAGLIWPFGGAGNRFARELSFRAGAGVDITHISPQAAASDRRLALTGARWSTSPVLFTAAGGAVQIGSSAELGAHITLDYATTPARYELELNGIRETVLAPWRFRPGLALALLLR